MNILIKLMSIVSLVIAPTLAKIYSEKFKKIEKKNRNFTKISFKSTNHYTEVVVIPK